MSGELKTVTTSGQTVYALIENPAGLLWKSTVFEAYNAAHIASYAVALTEQGSSGIYVGNFPTAILTAGDYTAIYFSQVGGSAAEGDAPVGKDPVYWSGTSVVSIAAKLAQLTFTTPNQVDASASAVVDSDTIQSIVDALIAGLATAGVDTPVSPNTLSQRRGDQWTIQVNGLGNISTRTKMWFTVKGSKKDKDVASIIQITEDGGLLVFQSETQSDDFGDDHVDQTADASIVVNDATAGNITVTIQATRTALLDDPCEGCDDCDCRPFVYDVQIANAAGKPVTLREGFLEITDDVTRAGPISVE